MLIYILPSVGFVGTVRATSEGLHNRSDAVKRVQQRPFSAESGRYLLHLRSDGGKRNWQRDLDCSDQETEQSKYLVSNKSLFLSHDCQMCNVGCRSSHCLSPHIFEILQPQCTSARLNFIWCRKLQWPFVELLFVNRCRSLNKNVRTSFCCNVRLAVKSLWQMTNRQRPVSDEQWVNVVECTLYPGRAAITTVQRQQEWKK